MPFPAILLLAAALTAAAPDGAQAAAQKSQGKPVDYAACLKLAGEEPDRAIDRAEALWKAGAGAPARHCLGVALLAKGQTRQAGKVLFDLAAQETRMAPGERAELFAQAGRAWLQAGAFADGETAFSRALTLDPGNAELYVERAVLFGTQGENFKALDDLNEALSLAPRHLEALVLRAAAWRRVGSPELAAQDVNQVLTLDPNRPPAWIEQALLHEAAGRHAEAAQAFRHALQLDPEGTTAGAARAGLKRVEGRASASPGAPASPRP